MKKQFMKDFLLDKRVLNLISLSQVFLLLIGINHINFIFSLEESILSGYFKIKNKAKIFSIANESIQELTLFNFLERI